MRNVNVLVLAALGAALLPHAAGAAQYFEANTRLEGEGTAELTRVRGWVDGDNAKIETVEGTGTPFLEAGSYLLTTDAGATVHIVNPAEMTYAQMNLDEMLGMVGNVMNAAGAIMQMSFSDFTNEQVAEEPGGEILGRPTTRYEYRTGYTMSMSMLGIRRETRAETQQEIWCADADTDLAGGFRVWLSPDRFRTGNAEIDELIKAQYQDLSCLPLRSRATTAMTGDGPDTTSVTVTEVVALREEPSVPAGTFELPSGYTAVSLLPEMPELPAGGIPGLGAPPSDAADAADAAEDEEPAEEGRRRGLGGLRDLIRNR